MIRLPLLALLVVPGLAGPARGADAPERWNIVLFLVDDLGWQDTSVPFHDEVTPQNRTFRTPAMEQLAREGMRFTQAYATPICSPTRISLMTGLSAPRHRVTNWTLRRDASNDGRHERLDFPAWNVNGMSPVPGVERTVHARALPSFLREHGYRTIHVGKAHFGAIGTPAADPRAIGFDVNVAGHAAGAPGSYRGLDDFANSKRRGKPDESSPWDVPGLEAYHGKDVSLTEALTLEAVRNVEEAVAAGEPFFLYLSHYAVHTPIMRDEVYADRYDALDPKEAAYASMVEAMDDSLGDVLAALDRLDVASRTVVMFMSDNGGLSVHARGGEANTHNRPLSSGKGSAHEGGSRVPMIVRWPGRIDGGRTCRVPVIIEDFFPTILEIAGVSAFEQVGGVIDGRSFIGLLTAPDAPPPDRALIWHLPNKWGPTGPGIGPASWIRRGDWKLIYYHDPARPEPFELFDLAADLGERTNRIDDEPERAAALAADLEQHLRERGAQWPTLRSTGARVPGPTTALEAVSDNSRSSRPGLD